MDFLAKNLQLLNIARNFNLVQHFAGPAKSRSCDFAATLLGCRHVYVTFGSAVIFIMMTFTVQKQLRMQIRAIVNVREENYTARLIADLDGATPRVVHRTEAGTTCATETGISEQPGLEASLQNEEHFECQHRLAPLCSHLGDTWEVLGGPKRKETEEKSVSEGTVPRVEEFPDSSVALASVSLRMTLVTAGINEGSPRSGALRLELRYSISMILTTAL